MKFFVQLAKRPLLKGQKSNYRTCFSHCLIILEDQKVLRRSPDLLNNVKIDQGQQQLIIEQILFYHIWGLQPLWSSDELSIKQPIDF